MQITILTISAVLAGVASAQSLAGLPACAIQCIGNSIPANCNLDPACICESSSFINGISCCVSTACGPSDQEKSLEYARGICEPAGITNLPTAAACTGTATSSVTRQTGSVSSSVSASVSSALNSFSSSISASASSESAAATSAAASQSEAAASLSASASDLAASASAAATSASNINIGDRIAVQGMSAFGAALMGLAAFL